MVNSLIKRNPQVPTQRQILAKMLMHVPSLASVGGSDELRIAKLKEILEIDPRCLGALGGLVTTYHYDADYDHVIEYGERALAAYPLLWEITVTVIDAYNRRGMHDKALSLSIRLMRENPEHGSGHEFYAQSLSLSGNHAEAIKYFEQAIVLRTGSMDYAGCRANSLSLAREYAIVGNLDKTRAILAVIAPTEAESRSAFRTLYETFVTELETDAPFTFSEFGIPRPQRSVTFKPAPPTDSISERNSNLSTPDPNIESPGSGK